MTEEAGDLDMVAAGVFAIVTGTFLGAVLADPKLAKRCAKEEVREQGFSR